MPQTRVSMQITPAIRRRIKVIQDQMSRGLTRPVTQGEVIEKLLDLYEGKCRQDNQGEGR